MPIEKVDARGKMEAEVGGTVTQPRKEAKNTFSLVFSEETTPACG